MAPFRSIFLCSLVFLLIFKNKVCSFQREDRTTLRSVLTHPRGNTRIVGGVETKRNEYPFIVSLFRGSQFPGHFCGGSIIEREWIVTAAHCASKPDFKLTAGDHDLRSSEGTEQIVNPVKVIRHPGYNPASYEDDIALVKVSPPFNYTDWVKSFQIPSARFVADGNVTTAGWGVLEEGSTQVSPVLRKVTIEVVPNSDCSKKYGDGFHLQKMICAGIDEGGKDACQGDSGGPLMCWEDRFGDTLCGVVSFGFGCARPEYAGVYTKVAHYTDWIQWEIQKDANPDFSTTTHHHHHHHVTRIPVEREPEPTRTTRRQRKRPRSSGDGNKASLFCIIISVVGTMIYFPL